MIPQTSFPAVSGVPNRGLSLPLDSKEWDGESSNVYDGSPTKALGDDSVEAGFTIIEVMVVVAILGIIVAAMVHFFSSSAPFYKRIQVRQQVMLSSREAMDAMVDRLRSGKAQTFLRSTPAAASTVPNSRADFVLQSPLPSGATAYAIYLNNGTAYTQEFPTTPAGQGCPGAQTCKILATNVTELVFGGNSNDPGIVGVTLGISAPWDTSGDPTHVSTILLPNHIVQMVESP
jgi:prepilin-type N-terminal cleavage/methylation domain-containing protein